MEREIGADEVAELEGIRSRARLCGCTWNPLTGKRGYCKVHSQLGGKGRVSVALDRLERLIAEVTPMGELDRRMMQACVETARMELKSVIEVRKVTKARKAQEGVGG